MTRAEHDAARDRGRVRIPADVEREDRLLANLTAHQLAILAVAGVVLWAGYSATRHVVAPAIFGVVAYLLDDGDLRITLALVRRALRPRR